MSKPTFEVEQVGTMLRVILLIPMDTTEERIEKVFDGAETEVLRQLEAEDGA